MCTYINLRVDVQGNGCDVRDTKEGVKKIEQERESLYSKAEEGLDHTKLGDCCYFGE